MYCLLLYDTLHMTMYCMYSSLGVMSQHVWSSRQEFLQLMKLYLFTAEQVYKNSNSTFEQFSASHPFPVQHTPPFALMQHGFSYLV